MRKVKLKGIEIYEGQVFGDDRGFFYETYNKALCSKRFVQDNVSFSKQGTIRGLHYQEEPLGQGNYITVLSGLVFDVAVDIRKDSGTYGQYHSEMLSGEYNKAMYIPEGFAHGFMAITDTIFYYKCTDFYNPKAERIIRWDDENLNIKWPFLPTYVSNKDRKAGVFKK